MRFSKQKIARWHNFYECTVFLCFVFFFYPLHLSLSGFASVSASFAKWQARTASCCARVRVYTVRPSRRWCITKTTREFLMQTTVALHTDRKSGSEKRPVLILNTTVGQYLKHRRPTLDCYVNRSYADLITLKTWTEHKPNMRETHNSDTAIGSKLPVFSHQTIYSVHSCSCDARNIRTQNW